MWPLRDSSPLVDADLDAPGLVIAKTPFVRVLRPLQKVPEEAVLSIWIEGRAHRKSEVELTLVLVEGWGWMAGDILSSLIYNALSLIEPDRAGFDCRKYKALQGVVCLLEIVFSLPATIGRSW